MARTTPSVKKPASRPTHRYWWDGSRKWSSARAWAGGRASLDFPADRPHMRPMIPFSILDLSPITEGGSAAASFRNTLDIAQHGERWGYRRYWMAEHHGMPGIASAATAILISHVAAGTSTIRARKSVVQGTRVG